MAVLLERDDLLARLESARAGGCLLSSAVRRGVGKTALVRAFVDSAGGVRRGSCESLAAPGRRSSRSSTSAWSRARPRPLPRRRSTSTEWSCWRTSTGPTRPRSTSSASSAAGSGTGAFVLATFRDDEVTGDHPLQVVWGARDRRGVSRLSVPPLSLDAVRELAEPSGDAEAIYRLTRGNFRST